MDEESIMLATSSSANKKVGQVSVSEKISVFISSSMRDEGDFSWSTLRSAVYEEINRIPLFHSFAIEHRASMQQPRSFYLAMVDRCDIVISIVKEELRSGTEEEIRHAIDRNKPLFLILIGTDRDAPTRDLLDYIQNIDYTTYAIRKLDSEERLARYVAEQLAQAIVDLVKNRSFERQGGSRLGVGVGDEINYTIPQTTLALFGDSSFLLAERFALQSNSMQSQCDNPYLIELGRAAVSWLVDGDSFSLQPFIQTILLAMKPSGIPENTLEQRLHALDAFLLQDYSLAYEKAQVARKSLLPDSSWLYGNCLVDERNLSQYTSDSREEQSKTLFTLQDKITNLKMPVVFPLAEKYRSSVLNRILQTARRFRLKGVDSTIVGDNTLTTVLTDLSSYLFASLLYGSVASFEAARLLLAHSLLEYSDIYNDQNLAFEGLRLLVLTGDAREFLAQLKLEREGISNSVKVGADELWRLSGRCPSIRRSNIKCTLAKVLAPYFSEEVFEEVEEYLSGDVAKFKLCRKNWIDALNSVKLRMNHAVFLPLLIRIVTDRLYVDARTIGKIVSGYDYGRLSKDDISDLANVLRARSAVLIKEGMGIESFAVVERYVDDRIVDELQFAALSSLEQGVYLANKGDYDDSAVSASARELLRQYEDNNTVGRYIHFAYSNAPIICAALDKGCSVAVLDEIEKSLKSILVTIGSYKGSVLALDEPLKVMCRFACYKRASKEAEPEGWTKQVDSLCVENYSNWGASVFNNYDRDVLRVRIDALKVASGVSDSLDFLARGVSIASISDKAQIAYLESLEWLIASGCISDEQSVLVGCICEAASKMPLDRARKYAARCVAACYNQWGIKRLEQAVYTLANDPADDVTFEVLSLSMKGSFGNEGLERRIIEILAESANWFIRWHVQHDKLDDE